MLCGAAVLSCDGYDADAELKALEEEMDRLEQEDKHIREHFLEKINSLRGRLTELISQVEQELNDKIEQGGRAVLSALNKKVSALTKRINDGFDSTRDYMDESFSKCENHIQDTFEALAKKQQALEIKIDDARIKGEEDHLAALMIMEKNLGLITKDVENVQSAIKKVEDRLSNAEDMKRRAQKVSVALDDLDEAYSEMERQQLSLLKALEDEITDDYLASLTSAQLAQVKNLVAEAEDILDDIEACKNNLSGRATDSEDYLSQMEDLADFVDSMNSDYDSIVGDLLDGISDIEEFWEFFEDNEAADWYDEIDSLVEENRSLYQEVLANIEEQNDRIEDFYSVVWDWYDTVEGDCNDVYNYADHAKDKAEEIMNL